MYFRTDSEMIKDIILRRDLSFRDVDKARLQDRFLELDDLSDSNDPDQFLLCALRLLAMPNNGHTRVIPNDAIRILPYRFVAIGIGIYLTSAPSEHQRYLDMQLTEINDVSIDDIMAKAAPYLAGTSQRQRVIGTLLLAWPAALQRLVASTEGAQIKYTFTDTDNNILDLVISQDHLVPAQNLYPIREKGNLNLYVRRVPYCRNSRKLVDDITYLSLWDFDGSGDHDVDLALDNAINLVLGKPHQNLVFDLRGNPGGNFKKTTALLNAISQTWQGRRCAVLVDKFTFSAAIVFVAMLKNLLQDTIYIVGEEMGDKEYFYAEGGKVNLTETGAAVRYSTAYHDWKTGIADPSTPDDIVAHLVAAGDLLPDQIVDISARDLRIGIDPQLDAAFAFCHSG